MHKNVKSTPLQTKKKVESNIIPSKNYTLIDGKFNSKAARDILISLFNYKVNYHELKNFSLEERFGMRDGHSEKRILELKDSIAKIGEMIEWADRHGYQLDINSSVNIQFLKK